jgi:hypothetical protein
MTSFFRRNFAHMLIEFRIILQKIVRPIATPGMQRLRVQRQISHNFTILSSLAGLIRHIFQYLDEDPIVLTHVQTLPHSV